MWIFHNQKLSNYINQIHEEPYKLHIKAFDTNFDEVLDVYSKFSDIILHELLLKDITLKRIRDPKIKNRIYDILECPYYLLKKTKI